MFFTPANGNQNDLCPFGYGQYGTFNGNGLSIYRNPVTFTKTLVVVLSSTNGNANIHNALKIGIDDNGSPVYNNPASRLFLNRLAFDGAKFLNPARPGDLYITSFQFNAPWAQYTSSVDAKTAVQIVQFTADQLSPNITVPQGTSIPTLKYCPPSAGPFVDTSIVSQNLVTAQRDMAIKLYNSADCNPLTANPSVFTIPHTRNACNSYIENATSTRAFKNSLHGGGAVQRHCCVVKISVS